jgi:hypothetical protein
MTAVNLYRSWSESVESFSYINKHSQFAGIGGELNKFVGAAVMRALTKFKLNKKYNVTDPRQMIYQASNEWSVTDRGCMHVAGGASLSTMTVLPYCISHRIAGNDGHPFRGGSSPNLADLTAFGVYRALQPYATGRDVLNPANTSPAFVQWFEDVRKQVEAGAAKANA